MGVFAEIMKTAVRAGVAGAGMVAARQQEAAAHEEPAPRRGRRKKTGCTQCKAVEELRRQRKRYGLDR